MTSHVFDQQEIWNSEEKHEATFRVGFVLQVRFRVAFISLRRRSQCGIREHHLKAYSLPPRVSCRSMLVL